MLPSVRNPECAWVEKVLEADRDIDVHLGEREYVFFSLVALLLAVGPVFTSSAQLLAGSSKNQGNVYFMVTFLGIKSYSYFFQCHEYPKG